MQVTDSQNVTFDNTTILQVLMDSRVKLGLIWALIVLKKMVEYHNNL